MIVIKYISTLEEWRILSIQNCFGNIQIVIYVCTARTWSLLFLMLSTVFEGWMVGIYPGSVYPNLPLAWDMKRSKSQNSRSLRNYSPFLGNTSNTGYGNTESIFWVLKESSRFKPWNQQFCSFILLALETSSNDITDNTLLFVCIFSSRNQMTMLPYTWMSILLSNGKIPSVP